MVPADDTAVQFLSCKLTATEILIEERRILWEEYGKCEEAELEVRQMNVSSLVPH